MFKRLLFKFKKNSSDSANSAFEELIDHLGGRDNLKIVINTNSNEHSFYSTALEEYLRRGIVSVRDKDSLEQYLKGLRSWLIEYETNLFKRRGSELWIYHDGFRVTYIPNVDSISWVDVDAFILNIQKFFIEKLKNRLDKPVIFIYTI